MDGHSLPKYDFLTTSVSQFLVYWLPPPPLCLSSADRLRCFCFLLAKPPPPSPVHLMPGVMCIRVCEICIKYVVHMFYAVECRSPNDVDVESVSGQKTNEWIRTTVVYEMKCPVRHGKFERGRRPQSIGMKMADGWSGGGGWGMGWNGGGAERDRDSSVENVREAQHFG